MEIQYWADIACPYCYMGITQLQRALKKLKIADQTPLKFMSFQLDPTLPTTNAMVEIGLPATDIKKVLESNQYEDEVRKNERRAFMIGIPSAPLFVINNKYSITGAQPYEVFLEALKKVKNTTK